jgi:Ca2+:H+ antiporter
LSRGEFLGKGIEAQPNAAKPGLIEVNSDSSPNGGPSRKLPIGGMISALIIALAIASPHLFSNPFETFVLCAISIIPLASLIATSTEEISDHVGQFLGGLLNATFGNAPEMIVALIALKSGMIEVVKASIIGTILANLLLALGLAMVAGGLKYQEQRFNRKKARINIAPLNLSLVVMFAPAAIRMTSPGFDGEAIMTFSFFAACLLLAFYLMTLIFSLKTHRGLYETTGDGSHQLMHENESTDTAYKDMARSIGMLIVSSVLLCVVSENLVASLESVIHDRGFGPLFTGVFLIPLFGGFVEFLVAVKLARSDKMDLSIAIATGSSLQISMFVAPILVLAGWFLNQPMNLDFHPFELLAAGTAVALTNSISNDNTTNWLEGMLLIMVYAVIGVAMYLHP